MPDPNNIILREHKLAFMLVCKAANTSVKWALADALGIKIKNIYAPANFEYTDKHDIAGQGKDWIIVSIVRNPYTRLASCWADKVMGDRRFFGAHHPGIEHHMPFKDFCAAVANVPDCKADQHIRSQAHDLCVGGKKIPNLVLRVEGLAAGWERLRKIVQQHCGLILPAITHARQTDLRPNMDRADKAKINVRYAQDFALFGYNMEHC